MIVATDSILKSAMEIIIEEMKNNPYLIADMLGDFSANPYLMEKFKNQAKNCQEWIINNKVNIYLGLGHNRQELPSITISLGSSNEDESLRHMGDASTEVATLQPQDIKKGISYILRPFVPTSYNQATGEIGIPASAGTNGLSVGMIVVDPQTSAGYPILEITPLGVRIYAGSILTATTLGIVPQYPYYVSRVEHRFYKETYVIDVSCQGEAQNTLWLWGVVLYGLQRYNLSLLMASGITQSTFNSSDLAPNQALLNGPEMVWSRRITMASQVEHTWLSAPHRIIENVSLKNTATGGTGISMISNTSTPDFSNPSDPAWNTVVD